MKWNVFKLYVYLKNNIRKHFCWDFIAVHKTIECYIVNSLGGPWEQQLYASIFHMTIYHLKSYKT